MYFTQLYTLSILLEILLIYYVGIYKSIQINILLIFLLGSIELLFLFFKNVFHKKYIFYWMYSLFNYYIVSFENPLLILKIILYMMILLQTNFLKYTKILIFILFIIYEQSYFLIYFYLLLLFLGWYSIKNMNKLTKNQNSGIINIFPFLFFTGLYVRFFSIFISDVTV